MNIETKVSRNIVSCDLKDVDTKSRTMVGAFTRYNVLDADGDIGRRGMFTKTWKENFSRIKHFLNHDTTQPIGKPKRLWDDSDYAYYESEVGTHKLGDDVLEMADSGLITEHSYGYIPVKTNKAKEGRELFEVRQMEYSSLTHWGAVSDTPLISFTKALTKEDHVTRLNKRMEALEKFCRNSSASDDTITFLLREVKQLQQHIIDINTQAEEPISLEPQVKDVDVLQLQTAIQTTLLKLKAI